MRAINFFKNILSNKQNDFLTISWLDPFFYIFKTVILIYQKIALNILLFKSCKDVVNFIVKSNKWKKKKGNRPCRFKNT